MSEKKVENLEGRRSVLYWQSPDGWLYIAYHDPRQPRPWRFKGRYSADGAHSEIQMGFIQPQALAGAMRQYAILHEWKWWDLSDNADGPPVNIWG